MNCQLSRFDAVAGDFPPEVRHHILSIRGNGGKLSAAHIASLLDIMGIEMEELMLRLLPIARLYARVPISHFPVGAVVATDSREDAGGCALYMGANMEFPGQALNQSIHAEQAASMNALRHGVDRVRCIAVTAAPCGHCRQFLHELEGSDSLMIISPRKPPYSFDSQPLKQLLPDAFGPRDLGRETGVTGCAQPDHKLTLHDTIRDSLVHKTLAAANRSYAPYTHNYAACGIWTSDGAIYTGFSVENAAFNPSMPPLQAAICHMNMDRLENMPTIIRAVLVEKRTECSQRDTTTQVLKSVAPGICLEYFEAEEGERGF